MNNDIDIVDIQISSPRSEQPSTSSSVVQRQWIDVTVIVENHSSTNTYHVVSSLNFQHYDVVTRTLFLGAIPQSDVELGSTLLHLPEPSQVTIRPGSSALIQESLPLIVERLVPSGGLGMRLEQVDLSDMQRITCRTVFNDTPFRFDPLEASGNVIQHLRLWGQAIERTFHRSIPTHSTEES
jgi:hypothetical protein